LIGMGRPLSLGRPAVRDGLTSRSTAQGKHGHAEPNRRGDCARHHDPGRVTQLAARRPAHCCYDPRDRPGRGETRGQASLEACPGRQRGERRPERGGSLDQRGQLGLDGRLAPRQQAIDGLIQAFGRGAGWQGSGLLVNVIGARGVALLIRANTGAGGTLHG
jgi:hypothetical protein